jgi:hypothetical protein
LIAYRHLSSTCCDRPLRIEAVRPYCGDKHVIPYLGSGSEDETNDLLAARSALSDAMGPSGLLGKLTYRLYSAGISDAQKRGIVDQATY